jgi:hypothetical protein
MKMAADLLRAPPLREQVHHHHLPQVTIGLDAAPVVAITLQHRVLVSIERRRPVAVKHLAAQLVRDRRRRPPQPCRDLSHPLAGFPYVRIPIRSSWDKNRALI